MRLLMVGKIDELAGYPGTNIKQLIAAAGAKAVAHLAHLTATRACTSIAALVYVDDIGNRRLFTHSQAGTVALQPQGDPGRLPLWTVYIPPGATVPLAAMSKGEQQSWHEQWRPQPRRGHPCMSINPIRALGTHNSVARTSTYGRAS